jgi:hypothetical protein
MSRLLFLQIMDDIRSKKSAPMCIGGHEARQQDPSCVVAVNLAIVEIFGAKQLSGIQFFPIILFADHMHLMVPFASTAVTTGRKLYVIVDEAHQLTQETR